MSSLISIYLDDIIFNMHNKKAINIIIEGLIQGVGFRPFVYKTALNNKIKGWVKNTNENVSVHAEGDENELEYFIKAIQLNAPEASNIENIEIQPVNFQNYSDFIIEESLDISSNITQISPDIAVCKDCLLDMKNQEHRNNYPLINCTHCGPRFSIIKNLPYDRKNTTMDVFEMCDECKAEYSDISDRRFHAQPVACNSCGPKYKLKTADWQTEDIETITNKSAEIIRTGGILAIKGTGGYNLACDAFNNGSVNKLRMIKARETKPFAVMFRDISQLKIYADVSEKEETMLASWARPIVLLKLKQQDFAFSVCNGFNKVGAFLPYMPFHYLLFEKPDVHALVMTSANLSDEPIIIDDTSAYNTFYSLTDGIISYNREIFNRTDDSVGVVFNHKPSLLRRSRGYAPSPVTLNFDAEGILAVGAELVNCFCIGKGKKAILSEHIGDLQNLETFTFFTETIEKYKSLFRFQPEIIVCDKHPDYLSTRYAKESGIKLIRVQHHYAHIASCLASNKINKKVIGFSFDGTGYGDDGKIWGGEVFICDLTFYKRINHLEYMPLPGGDMAVKEPWRTAVAYLYSAFDAEFLSMGLPFIKEIGVIKCKTISELVQKNINCIETSSMGRLFDVVSALINVCTKSGFHAEAPMRLENIIDQNISGSYNFSISENISVKEIVRQVVKDVQAMVPISVISAKFHNTVINIIFAISGKLRKETGINTVALSGGIFQNRYIAEKTEFLLENNNFEVLTHGYVPCNDAAIALGQLAIAAQLK